MGLVDTIVKRFSRKAVLIDKQQLTEHTVHLKIQGDDLTDLAYTPGEHLRVLVGIDKNTAMQDKVRTYSVWQYDRTNATIDIAVCTHSTGVGARWVREIALGDTVYFGGPKGKFTVDQSGDYYVFVGDISALAHLYEINRHLTQPKPVISLIYGDTEADFFPDLTGEKPFNFYQLSQNPDSAVIEKLDSLIKNRTGKGIVYVGGDGRLCVTLNKHFRNALHWESRQIKTKPFWLPNKTGLE
ncbi:siderophore-interacting protein [Spirosoma sp. HMF4905]|uniref:Siderophore-interacting protein n=1 Tax=Spirosoma arboris TaxID=2682092 RepID=A0A7K1SH14_9BACT|nr:siderophore-interacting protein [Spirosoma arboris]MVM33102.1 siderophore-interacting protein [Spirosoma arboris]